MSPQEVAEKSEKLKRKTILQTAVFQKWQQVADLNKNSFMDWVESGAAEQFGNIIDRDPTILDRELTDDEIETRFDEILKKRLH